MSREAEKDEGPRGLGVDRRIGQKIRARRLALRMTQEALAEAIGVSFQQVQAYEKGFERVSAGALMRIARALDINVAALVPTTPPGVRRAALRLKTDEAEFAELGIIFSQLNEAGRQLLLRTAALLASEPSLLRGHPG